MKLKNFNLKKAKVLHDIVAFKWIKVVTYKSKYLDLFIPDSYSAGGGEGRMGHRYTCEVLAIGPKIMQVKTGDRFLLHEYDKIDQSTPWNEQDIMFCEEKSISLLLNKEAEITIRAKNITDKMMNQYEDY